jgi:3-oxoadipate enol-lactonase
MISYEIMGKGEPLVLIHGLGNRIEQWESQHILSHDFRLIIPELRGHGDSTNIDDMSISNFAHDIIRLLQYLNIEKANICGFSLGGIIAQEIVKQNKHLVNNLILCNTTFYLPKIAAFHYNKKIEKKINSLSAHEFQLKATKSSIYTFQDITLFEKTHNAFRIKKDSFLNSTKAISGHNYVKPLFESRLPILIIGSEKDRIIPFFSSFIMYWFLPKTTILKIKGAGHLVNIEKSPEFNEAIKKFILTHK